MMNTINTGMVTLGGVSLPDPDVMEFTLQDISTKDAGRDESGLMHKLKIGQKVTYKLCWRQADPVSTSQILSAVSAEYFTGVLMNPVTNSMETRTYYVGDRSVPVQQWMPNRVDGKLYSKIEFTIIER